MPKMSMTIPHQLGEQEALSRIKGMLGDAKQQYGNQITDLHEQWNGNAGEFSLKAMGFSLAGTLRVDADKVAIDGDLPWAAKPFQGTIEATIRERAERLLRP